ncbi:ABC transporter, substrate-binding protein, aliphatic sulfonates family [Methanomethylovorans hollandica DSM 15978]|uniref:ABC transporter, substrate-binding protein, aliphatic sulfonates family n=1 Tax=Methanomethylovorans hollandica (strain DSM 15978 / NBRC 107637 / DMS1) TaxID=867904 RepID=L0KYX1_METHD|nr:ABC transporter substrate-binding protein [Methanomethylovorans hollandica]AGB50281.1 ABC transporter, substrate-binding protein, aliphatic sulfonates family [Methanomethylovorans hollandica DSM 15978]
MYSKQINKIIGAILIITAMMAIAFISGCTEPQQKKELTEIKFGYQPSTHQIAYLTAKDKGMWNTSLAPLGIVKTSDNLFPSGAPEMTAMLSGDLDVAYVGAAPFISALSEGLDAKIVAAVQVQGSDLVVRTGVPYEKPEDLKGLKIATFPPGTIQDTLLRNWLKTNNIDPDRDVTILPMTSADAVTAISAGQVDAVFLPHPSPTEIKEKGYGRTVIQSGEIMPNHACCVVVVSGDLIKNHPEVVKQIVKTHVDATEYNNAHPDEAAQIYAADQQMNITIVQHSINEWDGTWVSDPHLIVNSTVDYANIQYELGYIKKPLTEKDIFDMSFYDSLQN